MFEEEAVKFIKKHQDLTAEQIKKILRKTYPKTKIDNELVEDLISKAWTEMRGEER